MRKLFSKDRWIVRDTVIFFGLLLPLWQGVWTAHAVISAETTSKSGPAGAAWKCSALCVRGVYPHLAAMSTSYSEAGIGALVPWADRLWYVSYVAHSSGEGVGLYEILAGCPPKAGLTLPPSSFRNLAGACPAPLPFPLAIRRHPASIVGTHANRMIHSETNQLLIGPYVIDAKGEVRLIKQLASERLTGTMRHLTDPAGKVYYLAMEGGFYEVDLATLQARKLFELTKELGIESRVHFKGGYTAQGRVVVANNSYFEEDQRDGHGRGRLAEWDGQRWTILRRTAFCDVTTAASIQPPPRDHSTLWANGWDRRSVLLCILQDGRWHTYRLPKASQSYDQAWCTEWPRIRPLRPDLMLLDMHGLYYKMSAQLRPGQMGGLTPYAAHLKMTPDFCLWQDRLVLAGDENSSMNHRHRTGGQPQSNLWFGTLEEIGRWGRPAGWGGPWLDDPVSPDTPSDPFLIAGFEHRCLHLAAQPITQTTQSSPLPWRERPASANWPGEGAMCHSCASRNPGKTNGTGTFVAVAYKPADAPSPPPADAGPITPTVFSSPPAAPAASPAAPSASPPPSPSPTTPSALPIQVTLEVDPAGADQWKPYLTLQVPLGGYAWHVLPRSLQAVWMRLRVDRPARMSAQFHFAPGEPKAVQPELFAQLPTAQEVQPGPSQAGNSQTALATGHSPAGVRATGRHTPTVQINGALLPFADRLWFCAYRDRGPGQPAEPMGLYEITESLQFIRRAESVPGIFSNRLMVGGVPGYLSIGPHLIAADGTLRTIAGLENQHLVASVRLEEEAPATPPSAKSASGKKQKLGLLTASGRLLEVDLATGTVGASRDIPAELGLEGKAVRFRAAHTIGNTLLVAAVGQEGQPGLLAERSAGRWRIIDQAHYAEVCNLGSMSEQVVAVGWDAASTILMLRTAAGWQKHRLPKADDNYPPPGADYSPRIREVVTERLLLDAGGLFYEVSGLPYAWSVRPITTHNRRIADFCSWRGLLVLAGCRSADGAAGEGDSQKTSGSQGADGSQTTVVFQSTDGSRSALGSRSAEGSQTAAASQIAPGVGNVQGKTSDGVALWFGTVDDLWLLGKTRGVGGPWLRTPVQPQVPSDPYLMCHFDRKRLELEHDAAEPVEFTVEVDFTVQRSRWHPFTTLRVPPSQKLVYEFPEGYSAHWVRLRASRSCRATARFVYE